MAVPAVVPAQLPHRAVREAQRPQRERVPAGQPPVPRREPARAEVLEPALEPERALVLELPRRPGLQQP